MRALALTMKDPEVIILMTDLAADYEKLADRTAAKMAKLPPVVDAQAPTMAIYPVEFVGNNSPQALINRVAA